MNNFKSIDVFYIRNNKTVETVLVSNGIEEKVFFVYNYQGWFFNVFKNMVELFNFFNDVFETELYFEDEKLLDKYFETIVL